MSHHTSITVTHVTFFRAKVWHSFSFLLIQVGVMHTLPFSVFARQSLISHISPITKRHCLQDLHACMCVHVGNACVLMLLLTKTCMVTVKKCMYTESLVFVFVCVYIYIATCVYVTAYYLAQNFATCSWAYVLCVLCVGGLCSGCLGVLYHVSDLVSACIPSKTDSVACDLLVHEPGTHMK